MLHISIVHRFNLIDSFATMGRFRACVCIGRYFYISFHDLISQSWIFKYHVRVRVRVRVRVQIHVRSK